MLNTVAAQSELAMDKEGVDIGLVAGIVMVSIAVIIASSPSSSCSKGDVFCIFVGVSGPISLICMSDHKASAAR